MIYHYIKLNQLYCKKEDGSLDKRIINPDNNLKDLLSIKDGETLCFNNFQSFISRLYLKNIKLEDNIKSKKVNNEKSEDKVKTKTKTNSKLKKVNNNILEVETKIKSKKKNLILSPIDIKVSICDETDKVNNNILEVETKTKSKKEILIISESDKVKNIKIIKKKSIPAALKRKVWNKWIGSEIGKTKCLCCNLSDIEQLSFNCGHIISEAKGGELKVNNLKPICQSCNSSMGTNNMNEYIKKYGFDE